MTEHHPLTPQISLVCNSKDTTNNDARKGKPIFFETGNNLLSDLKAKTEYIVTNIRHEVLTSHLDHNTPILTWIQNQYIKVGKESFSLNQTCDFLNTFDGSQFTKHTSPALLKGIYNTTGYDGIDCIQSAPYLFFDIDVKNKIIDGKLKQENLHLFNKANNSKIFEVLESICVLVWRSHSKRGIAGILYVPQIEKYNPETTANHLTAGEHITNYLSNYLHEVTGVDKVKFDQAQSKFRQLRYVATQDTKRTINPNPFVFLYDAETKVKKTQKGITLYKYAPGTHSNGSIFEQANKDIQILDLLLNYGFIKVSESGNKIRVKHPHSDSGTTGFVDTSTNKYINFSGTFGGDKQFTPSLFLYTFLFGEDWRRTAVHLQGLGYEDIQQTPQAIRTLTQALKTQLKTVKNGDIDKVIFQNCKPLQNESNETKYKFIADNCTDAGHIKYFIEYLKLTDYTIKYDQTFYIENYVSEVLPDVLQYADKHKKIILRSETGKGKTTAFVDEFIKLHPNKRILILAPLTMIVDQNNQKYKGENYVFLTGKNNQIDHDQVTRAKIVFATYEQGTNWITHKNHNFDYLICDEIHQLLTANSFKHKTIDELTALIKDNTIIGLTGTPSQIFDQIGYKLLNVTTKDQTPTPIEVRYSNKDVYAIALNHFAQRPKGKVLMRINSVDKIHELRDQLVKIKDYKRSEILILHSTKEIKNSSDYNKIALKEHFPESYKVILTTSVIDEGISIRQNEFTDVVFIDTNYNPRGEAMKQFFARFRNEDTKRKNIAYLKYKIDQTPTRFKPEDLFKDNLRELAKELDQQTDANEVINTYNNIFSNNEFRYQDGNVNPYFLAYAVTNVLFQRMNKAQYLEFLENNYNLSFTINNDFEVQKFKADTTNTKERRQLIAKYWIEQREQVEQAMRIKTQSNSIRNGIHATQTVINIDVLDITSQNIKDFEQLYKRYKHLETIGHDAPNEILINSEANPITINSSVKYKDEVILSNIYKTLIIPEDMQTNADKRTIKQFTQFADWSIKRGIFSNAQMMQRLKEIGIMNRKAYNEKTLLKVLEFFDFEVTRIDHNTLISCKKKKG